MNEWGGGIEKKKTEARKKHIKKVLLDSNFRIMNIISLVAFIAMVYGIIRRIIKVVEGLPKLLRVFREGLA